jgi:hypothetical protein
MNKSEPINTEADGERNRHHVVLGALPSLGQNRT